MEATNNPKYKTLFMLAVMSGARQGEILGLKWTDIDWFNSYIRIQRAFNKGAFYSHKTKTSNRRIDIGPETLLLLKRRQKQCIENDLNLIFPNALGKPINQANLLNLQFFPALDTAKIQRISFHDLVCCSQKTDKWPYYASGILGRVKSKFLSFSFTAADDANAERFDVLDHFKSRRRFLLDGDNCVYKKLAAFPGIIAKMPSY